MSKRLAGLTLSTSPTTLNVRRNSTGSSTTTVTSAGFVGNISLSITGTPSRTSASLSPTSVTFTQYGSKTSTLTVKPNRTATTGVYTLTITGRDSTGSVTNTVTVPLTTS